MSKYFPPYNNSSENIKVELDLSNYAMKKDIKDITHVDASGFASKTNLAALKTEVDKIDIDKLKTVSDDLGKLSNVVKNDVVKKTEYNMLKSKVDGIDVSKYVGRTKYETDGKAIYDKIDAAEIKVPVLTDFVTTARFNHEKNLLATKTALTTVENKIPDVSTLALKASLSSLLPVSSFNSKVTELEGKVTAVDNKFSGFVKKTDYSTEITSIKNDYATNASSDSKLNDLKAQHIADEVKKVDDKTKKNVSHILGFESRLKQKEDTVNENERGHSFTRGLFYYLQQSYLIYECRTWPFSYNNDGKIKHWKSTGINNLSRNSDMDAISDAALLFPSLEDDDRINVKLTGNYFVQTKVIIPNCDKIVNIYVVYMLDLIASTRNTDFTIQNALVGAVNVTKNADISKNKYEGYGLCFDEGGTFSKGNINTGRNVLIFGVHESSLTRASNKNNNIYVMGDLFVQGINDTTLYAEKVYSQNFTQPNKKFVLSLHYNGNKSYLIVNGKQELAFKAKNDQMQSQNYV